MMFAMGPFGYPLDYLVAWALFLSLLIHTWCYFRLAERNRKRKRGRVLIGNALIFLCVGGCVGLAGESYLRFLSVDLDSFGMSIPARRWFALYAPLNSQGCRDHEWSAEKPTGTRRIAFVGDSFLFGWGVERAADRFSDQIASRFKQNSTTPIEVMNVAKPGWGTGDEFQPILDMIEFYAVDEIVLCYVFNDIEKVLPRSDQFDPTKPPDPWFFNPDGSCLIDYLYRTIVVPRRPTVRSYHDWLAGGFDDAQAWRAHQEQLGAIIIACRDRNVKLRVALLPFLKVGGTNFDRVRLHAKLADFLGANDVAYVDLLPAIEGKNVADLVVNRHDAHPNVAAHALFAERIWTSFFAAGAN